MKQSNRTLPSDKESMHHTIKRFLREYPLLVKKFQEEYVFPFV